MKLLQGLIAAPFTPLHADGSLALERVGPYALHLHRHGVTAAFAGGTTGEGASLDTEERKALSARWRADKPAALKLIVHVGHQSLADSRALARHAQEIGADAISALAPSFFRPASLAELVTCCRQIAAAAPSVPFYYYHMPAMTGVNFAMAEFVPRAIEAIPTFAGVKFTHENLFDFSLAVAAAGDKRPILFGRDEILLGALAFGATGAVGSTYNYMAPLYHRVIAAFRAGRLDEAREQQQLAQRIIAVMVKHGGLSAGKAIMGLIGIDCGPMRLPLQTLNASQIESLGADLDALGFFQAAKLEHAA